MLIRVMKNPHRSQQRLGFLKFLIYKASQKDSSTVEVLGSELLLSISKKLNITITDEIKSYIQNRIRKNIKNALDIDQNRVYLELQDVYLSDTKMPSNTGKLYSYDCQRRYPYLLCSLGFVRDKSYSMLVRGKVILNFITKEEIEAFNTYSNSLNPLILNEYQKYIFLFSILENDGDVVRQLYIHLLSHQEPFSDWLAGDFIPDIYNQIVRIYRPNVTTGADKDRLNNLMKSAEIIRKWINKSRTGGRGAKIDAITPRLELFVDIGLLKKPNSYGYDYCFTDNGRKFFINFTNFDNIEKFLNEHFFSTIVNAFHLNIKPADDIEILESIFEAYEKIKSSLGYATIKEIALLGAIKSIIENKRYFEIKQASELISEYQKKNPYKARFQVDRVGNPVYVKFLFNQKRN